MGSASTGLANLFWGINGCSERFLPLCINVISHSTQNAPGTRNKKMGAQMGPLDEQLLVPHRWEAWKNHLSCLFQEPNRPGWSPRTALGTRSFGEWPIHWPSSYPCLGHAMSLRMLSLLFQSPFLFKPFSAFPAQLRCCLVLEAP